MTRLSARPQAMHEKPLWLPMHSIPYYRFRRGTKGVEIRNWKGKWNPKQIYPGRRVLASRGYSTPDRFTGVLGRVVFEESFGDLPEWAVQGADLRPGDERGAFFDPEGPVVAFEVLQRGPQEAPGYVCLCGKRFEDTKALDGHILSAGEENLRELLPVHKEGEVEP